MKNYSITHEYLALLRYRYRHRFSATHHRANIDPAWFKAEMKSTQLLLAHDIHPSEEKFYDLQINKYGVVTYFPFLKEGEE